MTTSDKQRPLDRLADAYSLMLERANELIETAEEQAKPAFDHALVRAQETAHELGELSREEARLVADYLKRDMRELAQHLEDTGEDLGAWFRFDVQQIERRMWDTLSAIADKTALELLRFSGAARSPEEYRAGEISGPGTLVCDACGEQQHFDRPAAIPSCPRCHGEVFHRPK